MVQFCSTRACYAFYCLFGLAHGLYIYIYICVCFDILNKKVGKYTGVQHLHFFFFLSFNQF